MSASHVHRIQSHMDEEFIKSQVVGQPAGTNRLYGGYVKPQANKGMVSWINDFGGTIEAGTLSLIVMATVCRGVNPDATMELVGMATSRDRKNFGDSVLRLQVELMTAGLVTGDWPTSTTHSHQRQLHLPIHDLT